MWVYEIHSGKLSDPADVWRATGYSGGNRGKNPEGVNNPDMTDVPDIGPLPVGLYTFETPVEHSALGPFAIPLKPDETNEMFGRGGFYCHGDLVSGPARSASEGCIIMPRGIRNAMWASPDHRLQVTI